jgi:hypothetical protein
MFPAVVSKKRQSTPYSGATLKKPRVYVISPTPLTMAVAADATQAEIGRTSNYSYKPRDAVYGSTLQNFLRASCMMNEWCTLQVKCISRQDTT